MRRGTGGGGRGGGGGTGRWEGGRLVEVVVVVKLIEIWTDTGARDGNQHACTYGTISVPFNEV